MGQYRNEDARQVFAELLAERPDWTDVEVNLAIATLNRQREGDELVALEIVERVLVDHPEHLRARYVAGLMRFYIGDAEGALDHLAQVARAAPEDAHVAYFHGQALGQLDRTEEALAEYLRAIELDAYLRSAYYGAALAYRQQGEPEQARAMLEVYQRFANNPRAQLAEFVYTRQGVLAEALAVSPASARSESSPPEGPLFAEPTVLAELHEAAEVGHLSVADIDGDGRLDLLAGGERSLVFLQTSEGGFQAEASHPLSGLTGVEAALWGDLANRASLDVVFCRPAGNLLFRRMEDGGWSELMAEGGISGPVGCHDAALFDADHDGDLDLFALGAAGPNELFNQDRDTQWRRLSETSEAEAIPGDGRPGRQVLVSDVDGDRDADLFILNEEAPHQLLINDRLWRYRPASGAEALLDAELLAVAAADFEAEGRVRLIGLDRAGRLSAWRPDAQGQWRAEVLTEAAARDPRAAALSSLDLTGDGRPEILLQHADGFEVHGWDGEGGLERLYQASVRLRALTPVLLDPARGPALAGLVERENGQRLELWPAGPGRGRFVALAPTGLSDAGAGMRSNASGIGTYLVLRHGRRWSITDTYDRHGGPGQNLQPVAIGIGDRDRADFLKLLWSDGVMQTEMDLAVGPVHRIAEHQRQLASCPILYAWDGEAHRFVSDLLGVGGIGFLLEPGRYAESRPWEFFRFPEGSIAPREGRYEIKIGEPMEEIAYIDTVRLHLYDLPPGWAVAVDERMHTGGGPAPTGAPRFYREASRLRPLRAINHRGEEVRASLLATDGQAAPPGPRDPRFLGRLAEDHVLELDFGQVINPPGARPMLVASGWVEYPYSQTLFAAWQAGVAYLPPSLDAFAEGRWQTVHEQFGYPAGMPREMSLPLDALPPGTTALRLRGNWEVYWDEISVVLAEAPPVELRAATLDSQLARLARTGFPRRDTLAQSRPHYDYQDRSPFWDTRYPTGYYTDFGRVDELMADAHGALVVFGPGEELHLEFDAPTPPPSGWRRDVVLEVRGFAKDMDLYTRSGGTVGPLPLDQAIEDPAQREPLHEATMNRFQGGF